MQSLFVPIESTKEEKIKVRSRKALSGQNAEKKDRCSITLPHPQLAKDKLGDIYLRQTTKYSRNQTNSKETNTTDKTNLQHSKTLP